jgi:hypothetical protein
MSLRNLYFRVRTIPLRRAIARAERGKREVAADVLATMREREQIKRYFDSIYPTDDDWSRKGYL